MHKNGHILITGGAGFIGSHLADELINSGYKVRIMDNLSEQVHGSRPDRPAYLNELADLVPDDVRNRQALDGALKGIDAVFHLAAAVGVGQSMYRISHYTSSNNLGTAVLLEALASKRIKRLVAASSMSIYGEGLYRSPNGMLHDQIERSLDQLKAGQWEMRDDKGEVLVPVPTPENKRPSLSSVYALSKFDQEKLCLMAGKAYGIHTVALRFFNVYGTRQALSNPYTGVLSIFASRLMNDNPPVIYEDGNQMRDFVNVRDVARACRLALESLDAPGRVFNIGSGSPQTVLNVASKLARILGKGHIEPVVSGKYRVGDIRHCLADISLARNVLGFEPSVRFEDGLSELANWLDSQTAFDRINEANNELMSRGLVI